MREFRRTTKKASLYWKITQEGDTYKTEHGQIGTENPQFFSDTPGSKGKEGTKAYVDPIANCTFHVEREIRKKQESGYIEYIDGIPATEEIKEIRFDKFLPKNFCGYKPQTDIAPETLKKLHIAGKALYSRKYDGMATICAYHTFGWNIYTRRMDLTNERFPLHMEALQGLQEAPGIVFIGEMVCSTPDGKDDFKGISRFYRSDAPESRKLVEEKEVSEPRYYIFDILFYEGKSLEDKTYPQRRNIIEKILKDNPSDLLTTVEMFDVTPDTWESYAKERSWEGFVFVDKTIVPGDKFFSYDGDAKRPKGHHKLKPVNTEDVVIYAGIVGSGKRLGKLGSVLVKQRHPETKEWFRCGKVGSGFTDADLAEVEALLLANGLPMYEKEKEDKLELDDEGIVAMLEFSERQPGSQKFRFPVFCRTRDDKLPKECFAQRLSDSE